MPPKPVVSEGDVMRAALVLLDRGERVIGRSLRKEIGHGDQMRLMRIWNEIRARENDAAVIEIPPVLLSLNRAPT
jgi:Plasmid replication region DNA-binding N-term